MNASITIYKFDKGFAIMAVDRILQPNLNQLNFILISAFRTFNIYPFVI
jgi:hypothetical protein